MKDDIVFVGAKRTPFGKFGGALKDLTATELGVIATQAALTQGNVPANAVGHVIFGNVIQSSPDAAYLARHIALKAGCEIATPALTLNRLCGSGFEAVIQGAHLLQRGDTKVVVAGGSESMSQAPYVLRNARFGYRMDNGELEDSLMAGLTDAYAGIPMAITAENLAKEYSISRQRCDEFAVQSQTRASEALADIDRELCPVQVGEGKRQISLSKDEHVRPGTDLESLAKLRPVFQKDGVVTAGNASGMVDGACALVMTTKAYAEKNGWAILGTYVDSFVVGCDPKIMGIGPVPAVKGLLTKTGMEKNQIHHWEVNEAFAAQALSVCQGLDLNPDQINRQGGAIAIGHPLAATGARILAHLLYQSGVGENSIGSACIGGGQGIAVLIRK